MFESLDQNQIIFILTVMAVSAVVVGFMAGFFGIGGGLITVPVLFYLFSFAGIEQAFIMHLAVGTSFSIIIPTSIISTMTHIKFKSVELSIVKTFGAFVVIGVVLGTIFAISLKTSSLILFFSIMTMLFSLYFLTGKEKINPAPREINLIYRVICGFLSGFLSAPMGIGGGVINTPVLKMFGYPIKVAIGTSAAVGFLIALIGAIGFAISGSYLNINVPSSLGFINVPAFLIFVPITTFMAKIGAKTVHKFDKRLIGKLFGIYLFIVSCKLFYEYFSI
ncbi:MAG: sulfite exporter TauE/SafE family protein [Pelagibacteraceae bacterium]|nr:sulfite exporter TauE/SafE family protein [Pelagibacteraceae bacterium]